MNKRYLGIVLAISSAVSFGLMPLVTKMLYAMGGNPIDILFYRNVLIGGVVLAVALLRGQSLKLTGKSYLLVFGASFLGHYATTILLFYSYYLIPSGMATTIHFSYPILVSVGAILLLKRPGNRWQYLALSLSAVGIALLFELSGGLRWQGILLSLASAVTYAAYILLIERAARRIQSPLQVAFYLNVFGSFCFGLHGFTVGAIDFNYDWQMWLWLVGFAVLVGLGGSFLMQLAIGYIGGQNAAIISTFEPITSIVIGVLLLAEVVTVKMAVGMALIIAAALIVIVVEGRSRN